MQEQGRVTITWFLALFVLAPLAAMQAGPAADSASSRRNENRSMKHTLKVSADGGWPGHGEPADV